MSQEMSRPHVLAMPWPETGHVSPLMDLSRRIAKFGIKITFVNTESNHKSIMSAMGEKDRFLDDGVRLVSISDGMAPEEDRFALGVLYEPILRNMPSKLEVLIQNINALDGSDEITCVLVDPFMGWALDVANKMGIRGATFWPASAMAFALKLNIPRMIDEGIIDANGFPIERKMFQLSPSMPAMDTAHIPWSCFSGPDLQKSTFEYIVRNFQALKNADWWLCNSTYELELATFSLVPKFKPIGPLIASQHIANSGAHFWSEDSTCLNWLDQQPTRSVIYIAFGSLTVLEQTQFEELAWGLELSNRPFLWVVRPGSTKGSTIVYPKGFRGSRGKIVGWAPQQKVLNHPATACFFSHCGWNSIVESLSNGVPFLCWPQFADQFINQSYICDFWKVGLGFDMDENGIISHEEIKKKVEHLLHDENIRARSLEIKEMAINNISEGGRSSKNFHDFIDWLKAV